MIEEHSSVLPYTQGLRSSFTKLRLFVQAGCFPDTSIQFDLSSRIVRVLTQLNRQACYGRSGISHKKTNATIQKYYWTRSIGPTYVQINYYGGESCIITSVFLSPRQFCS